MIFPLDLTLFFVVIEIVIVVPVAPIVGLSGEREPAVRESGSNVVRVPLE